MSTNGTDVEEQIAELKEEEKGKMQVPPKDASALPFIERRIKALTQQRQQIAQQQQQLAMQDLGCQGALATLEALQAELLAENATEKVEEAQS